jgi:DNA-directed RNA polymerase specialized sigma24 family protein
LVSGFEWKLREVAELLNVSVATVQSHLERGMRSLRDSLEVVENE